MLSQWIVPSTTKKAFAYLLVLRQQPLIVLPIQIFQQSISIYLKMIGNFFNSKVFL